MTETLTVNRFPSTEPLPRIHDPRLVLLLRAVWVVFFAVALLVTIVSIPAYIQTCNCSPEVVAEWESMGIAQGVRIIFTALTALNMAILLGLSALIFWRRPDDVMAMYVALAALVQGVFLVAGPQVSSEAWYTAVRRIDNFLTPLSYIGLFFLFPTGRFYPRWSRWLLLGLILAGLVTVIGSGIVARGATVVTIGLGVVSVIVGLWALRKRYIQSETSVQKQQLKLPIFSLALTVILLAIMVPLQALLRPDVEATALFTIPRHIITALAQMLIPASIAFAMLRYRLWDVDLVFNRTLVSVIVTVGLAFLFILQFYVLHLILARVMTNDVYIAVALPAVITGLLFNPVRKRVRNFVDRRVFGFRFDLNQLNAAQNAGGDEPPITHRGVLSGQTLGDFKLYDVIGRGGMGEVYKSYRDNTAIAVKILPQDLAMQPEPRARFRREAEALTTLTHPNIVKFYQYVATDTVQYMAMELIEGEELSTRLKRERKISLDETRQILGELASALDYAHERGFIHRDIKPSNVMLTHNAETGTSRVVLMDFGIAKIKNDLTSLTGSGAIGTIDYMSPEQIKESRLVDATTDVYALGVVLYEMLTGELPFKGNAAQILFAHLQQPAPDPRRITPEIPTHVAYAIMRALAKNPDDRFQTAAALLSAFETPVIEQVA
jgi:predicted Ser/Thr protein kinase